MCACQREGKKRAGDESLFLAVIKMHVMSYSNQWEEKKVDSYNVALPSENKGGYVESNEDFLCGFER